MKPENIVLNIDELILYGFDPHDRFTIARLVQHHLGRLVTEQDVRSSVNNSREISTLDAGGFEVAHGSSPDSIGQQIARTVFKGIGQ